MSQSLTESSWAVPLVFGYDLVRDTLPAAERERFEREVLREAARVIGAVDAGKSNWQARHNAALLAIGLAVGDGEVVKKAIDGAYRSRGYIYAFLNQEFTEKPNHVVDVTIQITNPENPYHWVTIYGKVDEIIEESDPQNGHLATEGIDDLAELYIQQRPYPFRSEGEERVLFKIAPTQIVTFGAP